MARFMTAQVAETFSGTDFVQADVTFPGCSVYKYLLNIVAYNHLNTSL